MLPSDSEGSLSSNGWSEITGAGQECYLFDDEVLTALCCAEGKPEMAAALLAAKAERLADLAMRGGATDDLKKIANQLYQDIRRILKLQGRGSDARAFMRSTLAPLVKPGMVAYSELKHDVFGAAAETTVIGTAA